MWAEEELHSQDMDLMTQKLSEYSLTQPLQQIYDEDVRQLYRDQQLLDSDLKMVSFHI